MTRGFRFLAGALLATLFAASAGADDVVVRPGPGDGFVVTDDTGTIERLRIDEDTGNVFREGTLFLHTPNGSNVFLGPDADAAATAGAANNSAFGWQALSANASGSGNAAFGYQSLLSNLASGNSAFGALAMSSTWTGSFNSAFGAGALIGSSLTTDGNSAFGYYALSGNRATGNSAFGYEALMGNTTASGNSAFGYEALKVNKGANNSVLGYRALVANDVGEDNVAVGSEALVASYAGDRNTAVGRLALTANTNGYGNSAVGHEALRSNIGGAQNSAFGEWAFRDLTSGYNNVALGRCAGCGLTNGNYNIYLGVGAGGPASETGSIRIGTASNTQTFIEGIYGATTASGLAVFIDSNNQLGTLTSSIRFKEAVHDMGDASHVLAKLRPVTFRYRREIASGEDVLQYGLIAEEVAAVEPGLVAYDEGGDPYSVRYQFLAPMLVNEYQNQQRTIDEQAARIREQDAAIEQLTERLERLEAALGSAR